MTPQQSLLAWCASIGTSCEFEKGNNRKASVWWRMAGRWKIGELTYRLQVSDNKQYWECYANGTHKVEVIE
jgi:hypothetical protein